MGSKATKPQLMRCPSTGNRVASLFWSPMRRAHRSDVVRQLNDLKVPPQSYDRVVTSGDVTQTLRQGPCKGQGLSPRPDRAISRCLPGRSVKKVPLAEAHAVLCTGLVNDDVETPDDYGDLLSRMKELEPPDDLRQSRQDRAQGQSPSLLRRILGGKIFCHGWHLS